MENYRQKSCKKISFGKKQDSFFSNLASFYFTDIPRDNNVSYEESKNYIPKTIIYKENKPKSDKLLVEDNSIKSNNLEVDSLNSNKNDNTLSNITEDEQHQINLFAESFSLTENSQESFNPNGEILKALIENKDIKDTRKSRDIKENNSRRVYYI